MTTPLTGGYLSALYDILDFLSQLRQSEEDRVWSRITDKVAVAVGADAATYYTFLPKLRQLIARYSLGESAKQLAGTPLEIGAGVCGWVAKHREPLIIEDAYKDERFLDSYDKLTGFKTKNILAMPLHDQLDMCGVLELLNKRAGPFDAQDLKFVEAACRATTLTLHAMKLETMVHKVTSHNASILENLGGGFLGVDMHGRLILCNPSARKMLGISSDLPLEIPVEKALAHIPALADILIKTLSSGRTVKRQDLTWMYEGQTRVLGYSTLMIQDPEGHISGVGITFQDITNIKR